MGAFDLGWQTIAAKNAQNRSIEEQQRVQKQNVVGAQLLDAINSAANIKPTVKDQNGNDIPNPAYAQAQKDKRDLIAQHLALFSPEQHATFGDRLHGLIFGHPTQGEQQPALNPNNPAEPPAPATPAISPGQATAPAPPQHPMAAPNAEISGVLAKGQELLSGLKNHLSAFAKPLPPPANQPDAATIARNYRDPAEVQFERNKELWGERGANALAVANVRKEALLASLQARPPRLLSQTTIPDLLEQMKVDPTMAIYGPTGQELSPSQLAEMPPGTVAREFRAGSQIFYALGDQNSKTANIGGQIYQIPSIGEISSQTATPLGQATSTLPHETTHQVPGMNPGEVVTLHGTSQQAAPGATLPTTVVPTPNGAPAATPAAPALQRRPQAAAPTPTLPPSPSQAATAQKLNAKRSASRQLPTPTGAPMPAPFAPGTMLQQGRSAQPVVAAMSTVAANVFGGNGETPIWENAWMFDKPELRSALNRALTLNALAIPGTEDDPTFTQTLATGLGVTGWSQQQIQEANVQARNELQRLGGDAAMSMFARMAGMQEDLSALRAATKGSAAQGSIRTLVRAAPVYNVSSSKNFRDQLGVTLNTAASAMRGYPAINPAYLAWWDRGASAARGGPTSQNAPGIHKFAIDDQGRRRPVLDPNAKLPANWKWAD